jgi:hypothetical protein
MQEVFRLDVSGPYVASRELRQLRRRPPPSSTVVAIYSRTAKATMKLTRVGKSPQALVDRRRGSGTSTFEREMAFYRASLGTSPTTPADARTAADHTALPGSAEGLRGAGKLHLLRILTYPAPSICLGRLGAGRGES